MHSCLFLQASSSEPQLNRPALAAVSGNGGFENGFEKQQKVGVFFLAFFLVHIYCLILVNYCEVRSLNWLLTLLERKMFSNISIIFCYWLIAFRILLSHCINYDSSRLTRSLFLEQQPNVFSNSKIFLRATTRGWTEVDERGRCYSAREKLWRLVERTCKQSSHLFRYFESRCRKYWSAKFVFLS